MFQVQIEILRLVGPLDSTPISPDSDSAPIIRRQLWDFRQGNAKSIRVQVPKPRDLVDTVWFDEVRHRFKIITEIPGHLRERRNVSPAVYYASSNDAVVLSPTQPDITHHHHPIVPHLHCLQDVFDPRECVDIIAAAESVGLLPDIPLLAGNVRGSCNVHHLYWMIDDAFYSKLWSRVQKHVPNTFAGKQLRGLNRWFRFYKYMPDKEPAAHIGELDAPAFKYSSC
jgi:hypothetical protein